MNRQTVAVGLLAALVLLAGCSEYAIPGLGTETESGAFDEGADESSTADGAIDSGPLTVGSYRPYAFADSGRYTFAVRDQEVGDGEFMFDVKSTALSAMEVDLRWTIAGQTHSETITGSKMTISDEITSVNEIPGHQVVYPTIVEPGAWVLGRQLDVGASWGVTIDGQNDEYALDGTFTVTGIRTVAGVDCFATEVVVDGAVRHAGCFSPAHGFPIVSIYYDASGQAVRGIELTGYQSA